MTKKKYYFAEDREDENCFTMDFWKELITDDEEIEEITLLRTEPEKVNGFFWCKDDHEMYEKDDNWCGKSCGSYQPRNGKSGACKFYTNTFYTPTDKKIVLKRNGDKFKIEKL